MWSDDDQVWAEWYELAEHDSVGRICQGAFISAHTVRLLSVGNVDDKSKAYLPEALLISRFFCQTACVSGVHPI